jgi:hypothetical protein
MTDMPSPSMRDMYCALRACIADRKVREEKTRFANAQDHWHPSSNPDFRDLESYNEDVDSSWGGMERARHALRMHDEKRKEMEKDLTRNCLCFMQAVNRRAEKGFTDLGERLDDEELKLLVSMIISRDKK